MYVESLVRESKCNISRFKSAAASKGLFLKHVARRYRNGRSFIPVITSVVYYWNSIFYDTIGKLTWPTKVEDTNIWCHKF